MDDWDQWLPAIAQGDAEAFGQWMAVAELPLRERLRSFAKSVDTEAVVQETLLRLWQVAPRVQVDGRGNSLLRLGLKIARNLALDEIRKQGKSVGLRVQSEAAFCELEDECKPPDPWLRGLIEKCREKLPTKPAEALAERLGSAGAEPDEVLALRLGLKLNTFLQNFTRARKLLAQCLEKHGILWQAELR
jgi:DNA-directed RNA polymerase specialized sigma24 family protein